MDENDKAVIRKAVADIEHEYADAISDISADRQTKLILIEMKRVNDKCDLIIEFLLKGV